MLLLDFPNVFTQLVPDLASGNCEMFILEDVYMKTWVNKLNAQCCLLEAKTLYQLDFVPILEYVVILIL